MQKTVDAPARGEAFADALECLADWAPPADGVLSDGWAIGCAARCLDESDGTVRAAAYVMSVLGRA